MKPTILLLAILFATLGPTLCWLDAFAAPSISSTGVRPYTTYRTAGLREIEAGGVARAATVEWLLDGELRHVDEDGPPWTWPWSITAGDNGERRVTARAVDAAGQTSQRSAFPIRVQIPGVVVPPPDPEPEPDPEPDPPPVEDCPECPPCPLPEELPEPNCVGDDTHPANTAGIAVFGRLLGVESAAPIVRVAIVERVLDRNVGHLVQRSGPPWVYHCANSQPSSSWQIVVQTAESVVLDAVLGFTPAEEPTE